MSKELFFIGAPVQFKPGVNIYPPKVKEVVSNPGYNSFSRVLTYSQEEIEDIFVKEKKDLDHFPTPLEFLLNNCYHNKDYEAVCKNAFQFFLKSEVDFLYDKKIILVGRIEEILKNLTSIDQLVMIHEEEFFDFQNLIRMATNQKTIDPPNPNEHPKIKAMKAKARYRDRIKAQQAAKNGVDLFTIMTSICCMGIGINPLNIREMSYASMNKIMSKFQQKERYDIDIRSLIAGADAKKVKPQYWMNKLQEK